MKKSTTIEMEHASSSLFCWYPAVSPSLPVRGPPVTGRFLQKSTVGSRLREKSTVGGRLRDKSTVGGRLRKKKGRRRGKKKKRRGEERIPHPRAVVASGVPSSAIASFSRARRRSVSPLGEKDQGDAYVRNFADKDGKVWQGGGGRNPPPDAPHLVMTTSEIESLRPKSPPQKNQQQSTPLLQTGSSSNRRPSGNSPQNPMNSSLSGLNADFSGSEPATPAPWSSSPMVGYRGPDPETMSVDVYDAYGFNAASSHAFGDHIDFDSHRGPNLL
ncbi:hypothetical protein BHE74_00050825 [Ensete ventricosum]|nr:hypothetical protein GW17_00001905 [Ensete ventricosum]RWW43498.1 hypothetical protein BHE74_00050825 [Ensete ventricosum]RZS25120.1 hypothetical protein BHM03_00058281 [Ensete ventricosum]